MSNKPTPTKTIKPRLLSVILFVFFLIFIVVFIINMIPRLDLYQAKLNKNIQYYKQVEYAPLSQLEFDPYLDKILSEIVEKKFDLYNSSNSSDIHELVKKNSLFKNVIRDKKFKSHSDLFKYLAAILEKDLELDLIDEIRDDFFAESIVIDHLHNYYISILDDYLEQSEFDRLAEFSERAFIGFRRLDLGNSSDIINYSFMNQIILSKALFDYPDLIARNKPSFKILLDILVNDFPNEKRHLLNEVSETGEIKYLKKYWESVYDFQSRKFTNAQVKFEAIADQSKNFVLYNTARLMEARCVFWEAHRSMNQIDSITSKNIVLSLDSISKKNLTIDSYKSDIEAYKSEVEYWGETKELYNRGYE